MGRHPIAVKLRARVQSYQQIIVNKQSPSGYKQKDGFNKIAKKPNLDNHEAINEFIRSKISKNNLKLFQ